jgi:hypothetical protein
MVFFAGIEKRDTREAIIRARYRRAAVLSAFKDAKEGRDSRENKRDGRPIERIVRRMLMEIAADKVHAEGSFNVEKPDGSDWRAISDRYSGIVRQKRGIISRFLSLL